MQYEPAKTKPELLRRWLIRVRESQFAHYEAASILQKMNYAFGVPVVIISTIVGTSVFASLTNAENIDSSWKISIGMVSVLAAVLSGLQTFLGFSDRSQRHRVVAARYGIIRRELEEVTAINDSDVSQERIAKLRDAIDTLALDAPNISRRLFLRTQKDQQR
jgi:hypothetical protein